MAAQIAAAASLDDKEFYEKVKKNNRGGLQLYYQALDRLGLEYVRSNGNFILFRTGIDSDLVVLRYLEQGILLRGGKEFGRPDWIRVTIGTPEENRLVLKLLEKIIAENQPQWQVHKRFREYIIYEYEMKYGRAEMKSLPCCIFFWIWRNLLYGRIRDML